MDLGHVTSEDFASGSPPGTEKRRVVCGFRPQRLVVGLRGEPPLLAAPLRARATVAAAVLPLLCGRRRDHAPLRDFFSRGARPRAGGGRRSELPRARDAGEEVVREPVGERALSDVVAVVERDRALFLEL